MAAFRAQITDRAGDVTNLALPGSTGRGRVDLLSASGPHRSVTGTVEVRSPGPSSLASHLVPV